MSKRLLVGGAIFALALMSGLWWASLRRPHAPLPPIPNPPLADFPISVRSVVQKALNTLHSHPEDAESNGNLGMALLAHERPEAATTCFQRASALAPDEFRWRYYLGVAQANLQQNDAAAATFAEALKHDSDSLPTQLRLADCLFQAGRVGEALKRYQDILQAHPDSPQAHYGVGRVHAAQGEWAAAAESYRRACGLAPKFAPAHYALSIASRHIGATAEADNEAHAYEQNKEESNGLIADDDPLMTEVIALKRGASYYNSQASSLLKAGHKPEAVQALEKALTYDPKDVSAHVSLVSLYWQQGDPAKAEAQYRAALAINPNARDLHNNHGAILSVQGRHSEAISEFQKELAINANHAGAHNNLGDEMVIQGKYAEALQQYRLAVKNGPELRIARSNVASALIVLKRYSEAISILQELAKTDDENRPTFLTNLALAYSGLHKSHEALSAVTRAAAAAQQYNQTNLLQSRIEPLRKRLEAAPNPTG